MAILIQLLANDAVLIPSSSFTSHVRGFPFSFPRLGGSPSPRSPDPLRREAGTSTSTRVCPAELLSGDRIPNAKHRTDDLGQLVVRL
jgi:hypothetical protein